MDRGTRYRPARLALVIVALALALALPAAAQAAADPASAAITSCKASALTVAGKVELTGSVARRARGASLQLRFQALPLFGLPRSGQWQDSGRRAKASGQQVFSGLSAGSWVGVVSWRAVKGRRTVASGLARSQPLRIGGARGVASCTIAEGLKPVDSDPPALYILPVDDNWHHAPATVQLFAQDAFSGVKSMSYSLDGGPQTPISNGGTFTIPNEGAHSLTWQATDVAGNTGTRTVTLRVDAAPPTKPVLQAPPSVTANPNPTFSWTPSSDSGSGVRGYFLAIRRPDGSLVAGKPVDASTTSTPSPATLTDGQTYVAIVTAVDNTADTAWTQDSDQYTFRVDTNADATGYSPASGTVLSGSARNNVVFTINLDRAANPATVSQSTVTLRLGDGTPSQPSYTAGCANTPCTAITVGVSTSPLPEGHYTLSLNGVKSADEGLTFSGRAVYAAPYTESGSIGPVSGLPCPADASMTSSSYVVTASDAGTTAFIQMDITSSDPGGWTLQVLENGSATGMPHRDGLVSTPGVRLDFPSSAGGNISFRLTAHCSNSATGSVSASNLFGSRNP